MIPIGTNAQMQPFEGYVVAYQGGRHDDKPELFSFENEPNVKFGTVYYVKDTPCEPGMFLPPGFRLINFIFTGRPGAENGFPGEFLLDSDLKQNYETRPLKVRVATFSELEKLENAVRLGTATHFEKFHEGNFDWEKLKQNQFFY